MKAIKKLLLPSLILGILNYVIYFTEPPKNLGQASILQLAELFIPLFLLTTYLLKLTLRSWLNSLLLSLIPITALYLQGVNYLNLITISSLLIICTILILVIRKGSTINPAKPPTSSLLKKL